jgi:hypothetical protein
MHFEESSADFRFDGHRTAACEGRELYLYVIGEASRAMNWQLFGYEDPNYTNVFYPYPVDPPYVPDANPMGIYMRKFEIKDDKKKHYIVFEGVSSNVSLYINGAYVGYSQGNHLQAEFDVSDFVKPGENEILAKVHKWCSGSYLEDQDFFRFNGIFRDVYLLSRPEGHLVDIDIRTEDNEIFAKFTGTAEVSLFDGDTEALLREELARIYYTPKIRRIASMKERYGFSYWQVDTDDGELSFTVQDTFRNLLRIGEDRVAIFDVDGNRFEIESLSSLDRKSYKKIELYL